MKKIVNLNELGIENDGNFPELCARDNSISISGVDLQVLFRNQKQELLKKIRSSHCVLGCVAWLTDFEILEALSTVQTVAIVVQKEDFLRPDVGAPSDWKTSLRIAYSMLKNNTERYNWPGLMGSLSVGGDPTVNAVSCVGNHNRDKVPAFPRMHNKFLVFGESLNKLTAVWTGSFNLTKNASLSLENSLLINNSHVAEAFYNEFCQIYALSESLDWTTDWSEPELRIGT